MQTERDRRAGLMLKISRETRGLNQQQLSEKTGISRSAIAMMESGKRKIFLVDAINISRALNYSLDSMFTGEAYDDPDLIVVSCNTLKTLEKSAQMLENEIKKLKGVRKEEK